MGGLVVSNISIANAGAVTQKWLSEPATQSDVASKIFAKVEQLNVERSSWTCPATEFTAGLSHCKILPMFPASLVREIEYFGKLKQLAAADCNKSILVEKWNDWLANGLSASEFATKLKLLNDILPSRKAATLDATQAGDMYTLRWSKETPLNVVIFRPPQNNFYNESPERFLLKKKIDLETLVVQTNKLFAEFSEGRFSLKLGEVRICESDNTDPDLKSRLDKFAVKPSNRSFTMVLDSARQTNPILGDKNVGGQYLGKGLFSLNATLKPLSEQRMIPLLVAHEILHGLVGLGHSKDKGSILFHALDGQAKTLPPQEARYLNWPERE